MRRLRVVNNIHDFSIVLLTCCKAWRTVLTKANKGSLIGLLKDKVELLSTPESIVATLPREEWSKYLDELGIGVLHKTPILEQLDKLKGRDTVFGDGDCFPKLGDRRLADSVPSMPDEEHHLPAKIIKRSFLKEFQLPLPTTTYKRSSTIWSMKQTKNLNWTHEPDIQTFVEYVVEDIILMYGLEITLAREVSITALRPDFWVVRLGSIPIGLIEVKIPCEGDDKSTLRDKRAAGQVLDYLLTLRSTVGLCGPVFAILSTYQSWRVFWLRTRTQEAEKQMPVGSGLLSKFNDLSVHNTEETEEDREDEEDEEDKDTIDNYKEIEVEGEPNIDQSVPYVETLWDQLRSHSTSASDCEEEEEQKALPPSSRKRTVFADSKIYDIGDSTKLREVIATALCLMHKNSVFRQQVNVHRNLLLGVNQTHWLWIEPLGKMFKLHPDKFPNNNTKQLILLADLGAGLHGRVWLSCSTGGAICVMKFFTEYGSAKKELAFWQKAYPGTRARMQTFMNKDALIMPPFPPCMHAQKTTSETRDAVKQAVEALLNKGIWHGDLRWQNFGFHKEGSTLTAYAFDFGKSIEFHPSEKAKYEEKAATKLAIMFAEQ